MTSILHQLNEPPTIHRIKLSSELYCLFSLNHEVVEIFGYGNTPKENYYIGRIWVNENKTWSEDIILSLVLPDEVRMNILNVFYPESEN